MPSAKYTRDPTYIFHQLIDALRRVLGADQPEKVANILGDDMLEAIDMALPVARVYALADLLRALAEVQAAYDQRSQLQPYTTPYIDARDIDARAGETLATADARPDTSGQATGSRDAVRVSTGADLDGSPNTGGDPDTGSLDQGKAVLCMLHELRNAVGAEVNNYDDMVDRPLRRLLIHP
jgi:hypothetical protein